MIGKGSKTSPARYDTAVAADTTDVAAKSRSSNDAPIIASVLEETFNLGDHASAAKLGTGNLG